MFSNKKIFLFFILILISFLISPFVLNAEKVYQTAFKGKVMDISKKHIIIDKTHIALPKEVKVLDAKGNSINYGVIKKGDFVIVEIDKDKAVIKVSGVPEKPEMIIPR